MSKSDRTPDDIAEKRNKPPAEETEDGEFEVIGKNIDRVENPRLLTGRGEYIDDVQLANMGHAAVLRSPHAHARIVDIDTSEAEQLDGVDLVLTGEEAAEKTGPLPTFSSPPVEQYCIAKDRVRHVGEAVVAVVADDRYVAEDALERIDVEYEQLPAVTDAREALESEGEEVLHPDREDGHDSNVYLQNTFTAGDPDDEFADADVVVSRELRWPRSGGQPMETVGAVAEYDEGTGKFTIHANTSMYNYMGWLIATTLGVSTNKINIVPKIAGGSFGSKLFAHKVSTLAATLAREAGRPVKFIEDRVDNITSCDNHGSDRYYRPAELALDEDGTMRALRIDVLDDYGAYFQFEVGHHGNAMAQVTGPYTIESIDYSVTAVATNKSQQGAYRGFGSEVQNFVLERLIDAAADELEMDPVELRRENFIQPEEFPYKIPSGNMYDSGDYEAVLEETLELANYEEWREKQADAREDGRHIGIGVVTCQERSVFSSTEFWFWNDDPDFPITSSPESASVKIDETGQAIVTLHSPFWGNSPETVATQIVAEELAMDPENIEVNYADTDSGLKGTGPGGSRYTVMVSGALEGATSQIQEKMFTIAADMLEAAQEDLELEEGEIRVRGAPDKSVGIPEIAMQAHAFELDMPDGVGSGLAADHTYDHPYTTMPDEDREDMGVFYPIMGHMCHIPVIEVDVETGKIEFLDYTAVHDCGTVVNPETLKGHITGGTAQGIGTALYEEYQYQPDGQLPTDNYHDYPLPTFHDVPDDYTIGHVETPSPWTEYGIKGGGEGGRMGAPPAIAAAIEDALEPYDVSIDELPVTPKRVRELIRTDEE
ncbi:xanthine dehydrogenase family protein molybdopterin-binding subunit [Natrinema longum]|uniref:Xanthine dehydrogenase family protein n=1 Tax=Natrinema longum TaxID=370324 RepID=A0A8A2U9C0_9EURY|nr:xanthine dehydrogenase family protein molybdopterin-binding subunit [Natrinema longum]MBZ6493372.1 xanthine dehydrogenase family protein molybdopterin-binding subunit [Natrinema longum]QSW85280.1 xanthine dehydrogenase family protein [Natrinema longum]